MRRGSFYVLVLLAGLVFPASVLAQQPTGIRAGPIQLFPSISFSQEYTNNFFLLRSQKSSNWIFTQSPELVAIVPFGRHAFQGSYLGEVISHARFNKFNRMDHNLSALFNFEFPGDLGFKASRSYQATAVPPDFKEDRDLPYKNSVTAAELSYKVPEIWRGRVGYSLQEVNFEKKVDRAGDSNVDIINAEFDYYLTPKLQGLVEYTFKDVENPGRLLDNRRHEFLAGIIIDPTVKLNGTLKIGMTRIDFDVEQPTQRELTTVGISGALLYKATDLDDIRLEVARSIIQTSPVATLINFGTHFVSTGFTTSWNHRWPGIEGLTSTVHLRFVQDVFKGGAGALTGREDNFIQGGLGFAYVANRWLKVELSYSWRQRNSNFGENDFQEHRNVLKFVFRL